MKRYDSTYSFSWSSNDDYELDSLFQHFKENFGFDPFFNHDFFTNPYSVPDSPDDMSQIPGDENDSLYGYINSKDSVYYFHSPDDFFDDFFDDPFFKQGFTYPFLHSDSVDYFNNEFDLMFP